MSNTITLESITLVDGMTIALQADNSLFLSRINRGNQNPIEATKQSSDPFCQFKVTVLPNNQITLQADNSLFLSRINRGDQNPIEAAKQNPDPFCQFKVAVVPTSPANNQTASIEAQLQSIIQAKNDAEQAAKTAQQAATDAQAAQNAAETAAKVAQQVATDLKVQPPSQSTSSQPSTQSSNLPSTATLNQPINIDVDNWSIISGLFGIVVTSLPTADFVVPDNGGGANSGAIPLTKSLSPTP